MPDCGLCAPLLQFARPNLIAPAPLLPKNLHTNPKRKSLFFKRLSRRPLSLPGLHAPYSYTHDIEKCPDRGQPLERFAAWHREEPEVILWWILPFRGRRRSPSVPRCPDRTIRGYLTPAARQSWRKRSPPPSRPNSSHSCSRTGCTRRNLAKTGRRAAAHRS